METWNSDQVLYVLQYLNVKDLNRVSSTARRYYYLVNEYRRLRGPELVTARSKKEGRGQKSEVEALKECLEQLQSKPDLALWFSTRQATPVAEELSERNLLPPSTTVLEARASDVQSAYQETVESKSHHLSLLARFPNSTIQSFRFDHSNEESFFPNGSSLNFSQYVESLQAQSVDWKAFIVYACGELGGTSQTLIADLQRAYPDAIIVGGFCGEGYVSHTTPEGNYEIINVDDGVFGVALGGDVPMKSVVSRGAKSLVQDEPSPTSPLKVQAAEFHKNETSTYHTLDRFSDECGRLMTFHEVLEKYSQPEFIGLRRQNEDGFHIAEVHPLSYSRNMVIIVKEDGDDEEDSYLNAEMDLYDLDGNACKSDVVAKMGLLKEQTKDEQILGALVFTCNGRGPKPGFLIDKEMHDATCFSNAFPDVPCLGFYAGGEIGPEAVVARRDAFQRGNVKLQGFTAVFALFIVPKTDRWVHHNLDDAPERVKEFCAEKLQENAAMSTAN